MGRRKQPADAPRVGLAYKLMDKTVIRAGGGVFYDRDNSLMASLQFARSRDYRYRLNLYPGLIPVGRLRPGFFPFTGHQLFPRGGSPATAAP